MNLPNAITVSRLGLTAGAFVCLELIADPAARGPGGGVSALAWWAFALFLVAALTDFVDGYLARQLGQVTPFGRVADPFADKILICGTFIALLQFPAVARLLPAWVVVVIVARELLVTTLRGLCEAQGLPFPADRLGKLKMVVQCVTAAAMLTLLGGTGRFVGVAEAGVWVTLALTVVSGVGYTWKARTVLFPADG